MMKIHQYHLDLLLMVVFGHRQDLFLESLSKLLVQQHEQHLHYDQLMRLYSPHPIEHHTNSIIHEPKTIEFHSNGQISRNLTSLSVTGISCVPPVVVSSNIRTSNAAACSS